MVGWTSAISGPNIPSQHNLEEMGKITYSMADDGSTNAEVNENTGRISGAHRSGIAIVDVSLAGGTLYQPGKTGDFSAEFDTIRNPQPPKMARARDIGYVHLYKILLPNSL